jgi:ribonuclease D
LQDSLDAQLEADGRTEWVAAACVELLAKPVSGTDPSMAWTRLKDVRVLKPKARGVARALAAWRERRAMSIDAPVRQVLPDLAILGISQRQPRTIPELAQARGVDDRHTRGTIGKDILAAVEEGLREEAHLPALSGKLQSDGRSQPNALILSWAAIRAPAGLFFNASCSALIFA